MELASISKILGGQKVLHKRIQNSIDLVELGKIGVTKDALVHLARYLSLSMSKMAELLPITERTIQRYSLKDHFFNRVTSEQILKLAEVTARGVAVFDNKDKFLSWMNQPHAALANRTPMNLFSSRFGTEMILDELGRIEHGLFS